MESIQFRHDFSRRILLRMLLLAAAGLGVLIWQREFIGQLYFHNQLTATGYAINGGILLLFLAGVARMVAAFLFYGGEERALQRFLMNFAHSPQAPLSEIPATSLIYRRYTALLRLHESNTPIQQSALAATLVAAESTRTSLPRFVNSVLILSGVFGTIVSLSIALAGASNLLTTAAEAGGMGLLVHGMSTALNTTITAILCFLYFGYFFLKLQDAQTNLLSGVEQVTTTLLLPRFQLQTDTVLYDLVSLLRSLQQLVTRLEQHQGRLHGFEEAMAQALGDYLEQGQALTRQLQAIHHTLRAGFRLSEDEA